MRMPEAMTIHLDALDPRPIEYRVLDIEGTNAERQNQMNALGLEGWELVAVDFASTLYFRRRGRVDEVLP